MQAVWQMIGAGGPMAWALVVAGALAVVAMICALTIRRARRVAAVVAVALAMSTVGIGALPHLAASATAEDPAGRLTRALDQVSGGDLEAGCSALAEALAADWTLERQVEGASEAVSICVDHRIEGALAVVDSLARERALLGVASADASLTPTVDQFQRIASEVAAIPGAEEGGVGRLRIRSYEVRGPLEIEGLRAHTRDQLLRMRGCHARAWQRGAGVEGEITLTLAVDDGGRITRVAADGVEARFHACLEKAFVGAELGGAGVASRAIVTVTLDPA